MKKMNKIRFYNIFLVLALMLLGTTPLSAEVSNIPYGNKDNRLDNYPEVPSLLQPSDLKKTQNRQHAGKKYYKSHIIFYFRSTFTKAINNKL